MGPEETEPSVGGARRALARRAPSFEIPRTTFPRACASPSTSGAPLSTTRPQVGGQKQPALSRDLSEFLVELSIAVHRFAMYPSDHPSLVPAAENVISGLAGLLQDRSSLSIGVAQRQLVIEGVATDPRHPVLSDLARRLHKHQLGAVSLGRGTTVGELEGFLKALSEEPERGGRPVGVAQEEGGPSWEHIHLKPIGYDQLELREGDGREGEGPTSRQLWLKLAQAALQDEGVDREDLPEGSSLARVIEGKRGDAAYDKVIVGYLLQLTEELKGAAGQDAGEIRRQLSQLVGEMDSGTLRRMIRMGGGKTERKRLLVDASRGGLGADSVIKILQAAADVDGETISSSLTRLLSKLAVHAREGARTLRPEAESAIRESVEELISGWELDDPNPDAYTQVLDRMARASPVLTPARGEERELPGSERVIQMAVEVDAFGPTVQKAVTELLDQGMVGRILELLDQAAPGTQVAERLRASLMNPGQLRRMLSGEDVDEESLRLLVDRIGPRAVEPLFQSLRDSESRALRRKVFDVLARMGDVVAEPAVQELGDDRWFVKRNMLALLQRLDAAPAGFSALPYLQHPDPRVRREAFPLAARSPAVRNQALATALADEDERVVRMALLEVQSEFPETLVPVVVNQVLRAGRFATLRSLAVRALGNASSPLAMETLLEVCTGGRSLLGRPRLASKSPEVMAAISALARRWGHDDRARALVELARNAKDLQMQAAARAGEAEK